MIVLFLSPAFPPTAADFCAALAARGVTVLGIGDEPLRPDSREARALTDYVFEPRMAEYVVLRDVVASLQHKHGRIDRIDSNGEHWLVTEARLRDDFHVVGLSRAAVERRRSKLQMGPLFAQAGIRYPETVSCADATAVRHMAKTRGFPLVCKPEAGSGAVATFTIDNHGDLESALERELRSHIVQPFIAGDIITYDGLADRAGQIVFSTSHVYDTGIMQVRQGRRDGHYYSLRELPPGLEDVGRRAVAAFDIRERFFHVEFFQQQDGFVALEMNLRPPGGFTTDMMNAACDIDIYALWASVMTGDELAGFRFERKYHTAHAGRRAGNHYRLSPEELRQRLGGTLLRERPIPPAFAETMGDMAYLLRHTDLDELKAAIGLVQQRKEPAAE